MTITVQAYNEKGQLLDSKNVQADSLFIAYRLAALAEESLEKRAVEND